MTEEQPISYEEVQQRFASLWQSLVKDGTQRRSALERRGLLDQVRNALDRGEERLSQAPKMIVANTFMLQGRVHESRATEVHCARHRDLGTFHAVKTLKRTHAADAVAAKLLLHEGGIGLRLRHPHILATQAVLRLEDGRPALIFEWCGQSLSERLGQEQMTGIQICHVLKAVLSALDCVHEAGFVHCDLSPANLLFDAERPNHVRLADFGAAVALGTRQSELDLAFAGQPEFAAPEQRTAAPLDGRCDLFAAGRLLSLLLNHCDNGNDLEGPIPPIGALRAFAARLSHPQPEGRPENAKAAQAALDGFRIIT